jgi:hypothetical protein
MNRPATLAVALGCLAIAAGGVAQAVTVGPGATTINMNDTSSPITVVELADSTVLAAGTYTVADFSTQFTSSAAGTLTPFLVADNGGVFTPLAIGASFTNVTATGAFQSYAFGGSDTFTLTAATQVDAAFTFSGVDSPVGFLNGSGSTFIFYSAGAPSPDLGTALDGGLTGAFPRTYDFSLTIAGVPEAGTWALMIVGLGAAGAALRARRRSAALPA